MNKERAINILLEHAIRSCEKVEIRKECGHTEELDSALTEAILFIQRDKKQNKVDAKVEVEGLQFNLHKGI